MPGWVGGAAVEEEEEGGGCEPADMQSYMLHCTYTCAHPCTRPSTVQVHVNCIMAHGTFTYMYTCIHVFLDLNPANWAASVAQLAEHWTNPVVTGSNPVRGSSVLFHCLPSDFAFPCSICIYMCEIDHVPVHMYVHLLAIANFKGPYLVAEVVEEVTGWLW